MMRRLLAAAFLSALAAGPAPAATATSTMAVTTRLQSTCLASVAALAFPSYTPGGGARNANTAIRVRCTRGTAFTVSLDAGSTGGGTFAQRLMGSAAGSLQYNLYTNAARNRIFGDGTAATFTRSGTGAGLATSRTVTVYGQLPDSAANRLAAPGSYTDTITVSVSY